jgi:hypothetical protein
MRITLYISEGLYQALKAKAAREKRILEELIIKNLRNRFLTRSVKDDLRTRPNKKRRRVRLPLTLIFSTKAFVRFVRDG